jgi:hypothetical protein
MASPNGGHKRQIEIAVPVFDYKESFGIDREHGFLRRSNTDLARRRGAMAEIW